jgi:hypothetical protein
MTYKIEFKQPSNIVALTYSGKVDLDMRLKTVDEICKKYSELGPLRVLVDVRNLEMDMLFGEQEAFGEYLANHYDLRDSKVAILHDDGFNPNTVIDISAYNNGLRLNEFSNPHEAEKWLLQTEPD